MPVSSIVFSSIFCNATPVIPGSPLLGVKVPAALLAIVGNGLPISGQSFAIVGRGQFVIATTFPFSLSVISIL
jgi:hypothetical protein